MKSIVLLLLDSLRFDHVTSEIMPNLMEIARDGIVYTNCISGNTDTVKSLPIILCGEPKYFSSFSIMMALRKRGYRSILINTNILVERYFSQGWDEVINLEPNPNKSRMIYHFKKLVPPFAFQIVRWLYRSLTNFSAELPYSRADVMLKVAREVISILDHKLFFIWVHLMDPHQPYYPNNSLYSNYELVKLNDKMIDSYHKRYTPSEEDVDIWKELYRKNVSEMDIAIGEFYGSIDWSDKILVITSDHGEEFGENGGFLHQADKFIPELQHVPLIIYGLGKGIVKEEFSHYNFAQLLYNCIEED